MLSSSSTSQSYARPFFKFLWACLFVAIFYVSSRVFVEMIGAKLPQVAYMAFLPIVFSLIIIMCLFISWDTHDNR